MESEDEKHKGRPRKLVEDSLHGYWRRKAQERKERAEVDKILDTAFNVETQCSGFVRGVGR